MGMPMQGGMQGGYAQPMQQQQMQQQPMQQQPMQHQQMMGIPSSPSGSQMVVNVPAGVAPGQPFQVNANGQVLTLSLGKSSRGSNHACRSRACNRTHPACNRAHPRQD